MTNPSIIRLFPDRFQQHPTLGRLMEAAKSPYIAISDLLFSSLKIDRHYGSI